MRLTIQALLFLPLLFGYWFLHGQLAMWVDWIPDLFSDRPFRLAGLLFGTVVCGVLAGAAFAWPVRLIYRQYDLAIAVAIAIGAATFDALHMQLDGRLPFTQVALLLDLAIFVAALPVCVLAARRLRPNQSFKPTPSARLNSRR